MKIIIKAHSTKAAVHGLVCIEAAEEAGHEECGFLIGDPVEYAVLVRRTKSGFRADVETRIAEVQH